MAACTPEHDVIISSSKSVQVDFIHTSKHDNLVVDVQLCVNSSNCSAVAENGGLKFRSFETRSYGACDRMVDMLLFVMTGMITACIHLSRTAPGDLFQKPFLRRSACSNLIQYRMYSNWEVVSWVSGFSGYGDGLIIIERKRKVYISSGVASSTSVIVSMHPSLVGLLLKISGIAARIAVLCAVKGCSSSLFTSTQRFSATSEGEIGMSCQVIVICRPGVVWIFSSGPLFRRSVTRYPGL